MDAIEIRPAEKKDASGIAKVHIETWQYAYKGLMPDNFLANLSIEKRTKRWEELLSNPTPESQSYVAITDNKLIGFCSVGRCRDKDMSETTGELYAIYIDSNFMNKGAGSALQEKGLQYLREKGYKKATLWVLTSNSKTIKWYESQEWRFEGKTKTADMDGFQLHESRYIIDLT
jgi:ribosomal protein S18 acetylase RimI-like enzyme